MHITVMLLGGVLGFGSGLFAYFGLGFGLLASIGLWAASGPLCLVGMAAVYMLQPAANARPEAGHPEIA